MNRLCLAAAVILCGLAAACREASPPPRVAAERTTPSAAPTAPPPPITAGLPSWPSEPALTIALPARPLGTVTTKAMFETGGTVVEQTWPDGSRERWWYAVDGATHHVARGQKAEDAAP